MSNPIRKEPALVAGIITAAVGLLLVYEVLDAREAAAWSALLLPLAQALATRFLVFSPNTIREAGLDPDSVKRRASDPLVPRCDR